MQSCIEVSKYPYVFQTEKKSPTFPLVSLQEMRIMLDAALSFSIIDVTHDLWTYTKKQYDIILGPKLTQDSKLESKVNESSTSLSAGVGNQKTLSDELTEQTNRLMQEDLMGIESKLRDDSISSELKELLLGGDDEIQKQNDPTLQSKTQSSDGELIEGFTDRVKSLRDKLLTVEQGESEKTEGQFTKSFTTQGLSETLLAA